MRKKAREFYVLLGGRSNCEGVYSINWACHGKKGVYDNHTYPGLGDKIIKVREVLPLKKKVSSKK